MSIRPEVDQNRIEQFLSRLGKLTNEPARVLLVGGCAVVHAGLRARTLDIDVALEGQGESEVLASMRQLTHEMQINVELASPGDFIPLPTGWHDRAVWVGRYNTLDVFYFDFYSVALSKIARSQERDVNDIVLLAGRGYIHLDQLDTFYEEILPQVGKGRYFNVDPADFAANYAAIRQKLVSGAPASEPSSNTGGQTGGK